MEALRGVDLAIRPGEVVAMLGPNGAGKTTSISLMIGLRRPTSGEVRLFGLPPTDRRARSRCGVMLQESGTTAVLTVAEIVDLFRAYYPAPLPAELEVQFDSLVDAQAAGFLFVDVRDARERAEDPLGAPALNLPMSKLLTDAAMLDSGGRYLLICATGKRSSAAADLLRSQGYTDCRSLRGGLKGLKASA